MSMDTFEKLSLTLRPLALSSFTFPSGKSWAKKRTKRPMKMCIVPGTKKARRHAVKLGDLKGPLMSSKISGIMSWVKPPPRLPQPAVIPLAVPTIDAENMVLIQNWQDTKVARENPMKKRDKIKPTVVDTVAMQKIAGAVSMTNDAQA